MSRTTRIIRSNRTQAVPLPHAVAFPDDVTDVEVTVVGTSRIISPVGKRWDAYFARGSTISDDFERGGRETGELNRTASSALAPRSAPPPIGVACTAVTV